LIDSHPICLPIMSDVDAPVMTEKRRKKLEYRARLEEYLAEFENILIIGVDHVGSRQLQQVRLVLRGQAKILMGKNTIIRRVLQDLVEAGQRNLACLIPLVRGNVGFVFTNADMGTIRDLVVENKVPAAARPGVIAPVDVFIPAGPTGLDPGQTPFFQALNIGTKISRGAIDIINKVHLIQAGEKVSPSAVALLGKLDVKPFFFGITVKMVYNDGSTFSPDVLDLTDAILIGSFFQSVNAVAALSLEVGIPTLASVRHSFINGFKKILAVSLATEYTFEEAQIFKDFLADPSAFAAPAAEAAPAEEEAGGDDDESSSDDDDDDSEAFNMFDSD